MSDPNPFMRRIAQTNDTQAAALLAVAFEVRTANLLALYNAMRDEGLQGSDVYEELAATMVKRLGMEPNE